MVPRMWILSAGPIFKIFKIYKLDDWTNPHSGNHSKSEIRDWTAPNLHLPLWGVNMRFLERLLLLIGIVCLGLYGFFKVQAYVHQTELERMLEVERSAEPPHATGEVPRSKPRRVLREGDLFGRLEIPRLNMSVMVMEGVSDRTLRLGAGHISGTSMGIAAYLDRLFPPL